VAARAAPGDEGAGGSGARLVRVRSWAELVGQILLKLFAECRGDVALGKEFLCRVPLIWHSAKNFFLYFKKFI
jgi:hypothetical protein